MKRKINVEELANIIDRNNECGNDEYKACFNLTTCGNNCAVCKYSSFNKNQWLNGMKELLINNNRDKFVHLLILLGCAVTRKNKDKDLIIGCYACPLFNKETKHCGLKEHHFEETIKYLLDYEKGL